MSTPQFTSHRPEMGPYQAVLLGTAQDGGVPQAGCACPHCRAAWQDPAQRRQVVCLGLVDHPGQRFWLVDATPDFREQLHAMQDRAPSYSLAGILLTHGHIGHYTGLIHLGKEAWHARDLPLYASGEMVSFLAQHAPWCQLLADGNVSPIRDLGDFLDQVDVALVDGCFFHPDELPGRDIREIPHPLVTDTLTRIRGRRAQVIFVHLNHTNPLLHTGPAQDTVRAAGAFVGREGQVWAL